MITLGEHVLWSYINPINDPTHYACVMIWKKGTQPKVLLQSAFPASDFMLSTKNDEIYIIERKFLETSDEFHVRILKTSIGKEPTVIWDWFKDEYRIGEGGFFMKSDTHLVFGKYPNVYSLEKGAQPTKYFQFTHPINRIRMVENSQILLIGDNSCYLVKHDGSIIRQWDKLIDENVKNAPLNRNQLFDADYANKELLISYWGKRSFELIELNGKRHVILQETSPVTPHWVAFWNQGKLLFSSKLRFDGSTPKPLLTLIDHHNNQTKVWSIP